MSKKFVFDSLQNVTGRAFNYIFMRKATERY